MSFVTPDIDLSFTNSSQRTLTYTLEQLQTIMTTINSTPGGYRTLDTNKIMFFKLDAGRLLLVDTSFFINYRWTRSYKVTYDETTVLFLLFDSTRTTSVERKTLNQIATEFNFAGTVQSLSQMYLKIAILDDTTTGGGGTGGGGTGGGGTGGGGTGSGLADGFSIQGATIGNLTTTNLTTTQLSISPTANNNVYSKTQTDTAIATALQNINLPGNSATFGTLVSTTGLRADGEITINGSANNNVYTKAQVDQAIASLRGGVPVTIPDNFVVSTAQINSLTSNTAINANGKINIAINPESNVYTKAQVDQLIVDAIAAGVPAFFSATGATIDNITTKNILFSRPDSMGNLGVYKFDLGLIGSTSASNGRYMMLQNGGSSAQTIMISTAKKSSGPIEACTNLICTPTGRVVAPTQPSIILGTNSSSWLLSSEFPYVLFPFVTDTSTYKVTPETFWESLVTPISYQSNLNANNCGRLTIRTPEGFGGDMFYNYAFTFQTKIFNERAVNGFVVIAIAVNNAEQYKYITPGNFITNTGNTTGQREYSGIVFRHVHKCVAEINNEWINASGIISFKASGTSHTIDLLISNNTDDTFIGFDHNQTRFTLRQLV